MLRKLFKFHGGVKPQTNKTQSTTAAIAAVRGTEFRVTTVDGRMRTETLSGEVALTYEAVVDNGFLLGLPPGVTQHDWNDLPAEVLTYLWPSRYCPSDQFGRFVERQFGAGLLPVDGNHFLITIA